MLSQVNTEFFVANPAILALADGTIFKGLSIGAQGTSVGEIVFNTSMTGYQEILTDPSYAQQIVTLTYPHIGNTGINTEDMESDKVYAAGLVIRDNAMLSSNWRSNKSLSEFLIEQGIVGISQIDTRKLTRIIREQGAQAGCIMAGDIDEQQAVNLAKSFAGLEGVDLAKQVTCKQPYEWIEGVQVLHETTKANSQQYHVVVYDFGIKRNILRLLAEQNCKVTVVPAQTPAKTILDMKPHGVFLSNGPGDPIACDYAIENIKMLLRKSIPMFGICLGHQLLALAAGARTQKMKYGHHGANHPVQDLKTKKVFITSQNHGFAVEENSLPAGVIATHKSLFDDTLQGIELSNVPAFSFQGHPEASPGPQDIAFLFEKFIALFH